MFNLLLLPNTSTALPSELTPYCSARSCLLRHYNPLILFYFILNYFYFILFLSLLTLYNCVNKVYILVVLRIKKELLVLEYMDRNIWADVT